VLSPAPKAFGVSPAPDGGYPSNNTAEGTNALFSNTTGRNNVAVGFKAGANLTTGNNNIDIYDAGLAGGLQHNPHRHGENTDHHIYRRR
jgi:hypothetical protein